MWRLKLVVLTRAVIRATDKGRGGGMSEVAYLQGNFEDLRFTSCTQNLPFTRITIFAFPGPSEITPLSPTTHTREQRIWFVEE